MDLDGISLASIKGLYLLSQEQNRRILEQEKRILEQDQRITLLENNR
jgi:hypothetical protein